MYYERLSRQMQRLFYFKEIYMLFDTVRADGKVVDMISI